MGVYINPSDKSKQDWLNRHATPLPGAPQSLNDVEEGYLPILLLNNGAFDALLVAYSQRELDAVRTPHASDMRSHRWYSALISEIDKVSDLEVWQGRKAR